MARVRTIGGLIVVLASLLLGSLALASPPADAQGSFPVAMNDMFARLHAVRDGEPCPAAHTDVGPITLTNGFRWCAPDGYNRVVQTIAECNQAVAELGIGFLDPDLQPPVCWSFFAFLGPGDVCQPPAVHMLSPVGDICVGPVFALGSGGVVTAALPVCIESATVQDDENVANHVVGSVYFDADDVARVIVTGTTSCAFNCADGFDANCDGALGDFCAVELNLNVVKDVGTCLAALNPSAAAPASASPAVAAAVAIPVDSTLAHTGPSDVLPPVAFWLLGIGATTLATAHHARGRRQQ